jgi:hypothetical protein
MFRWIRLVLRKAEIMIHNQSLSPQSKSSILLSAAASPTFHQYTGGSENAGEDCFSDLRAACGPPGRKQETSTGLEINDDGNSRCGRRAVLPF